MARRRNNERDETSPHLPFWVWVILGIGLISRLILAQSLELRTDEAYYWTQSKEWVFSYLDHPPMVAWFIKLGTGLFGDTLLGVRIMFILALFFSQYLVAEITRMMTRDRRALLFATLALEAMLYYATMGVIVAPDGPLILFSLLMAYALVQLEFSGDERLWVLAGAAAGLAALSKYLIIFFAPALLLYLFISKRNRKWLTTPWPWLALLLAVFIFSPVLLWNAVNDWASFRFQGARVIAAEGFHIQLVFDYLGLQFGLVGLLLFPLLLWGAMRVFWRGWFEGNGALTLIALLPLTVFGYFLYRSFGLRINVTWPLIIWPFAVIATAIHLDRLFEKGGVWSWKWAKIALSLGFISVALAYFYYVFDTKARLGKNDPIGAEAGFEEVAEQVLAEMVKRRASWLATTDYRTYAMMKWHLRAEPIQVVQLNERARFLGFKPTPRGRIDEQRGLHLAPMGKYNPAVWVSIPTSRERIGTFERTWRGLKIESYIVDEVKPYKPELEPPKDSPLYKPRVLA
jgi:4-amino-4-deoxy-L-arabinose transferase-like glycosyltransferase